MDASVVVGVGVGGDIQPATMDGRLDAVRR